MAQLHLSKKFYPHRQAQANDTWDEPGRIEPAPAMVRSRGRAFRPARWCRVCRVGGAYVIDCYDPKREFGFLFPPPRGGHTSKRW